MQWPARAREGLGDRAPPLPYRPGIVLSVANNHAYDLFPHVSPHMTARRLREIGYVRGVARVVVTSGRRARGLTSSTLCALPRCHSFQVVGDRYRSEHQEGVPGTAYQRIQKEGISLVTEIQQVTVEVENMTSLIITPKGYRLGVVAWTDLMNNPFEFKNKDGRVVIDEVRCGAARVLQAHRGRSTAPGGRFT